MIRYIGGNSLDLKQPARGMLKDIMAAVSQCSKLSLSPATPPGTLNLSCPAASSLTGIGKKFPAVSPTSPDHKSVSAPYKPLAQEL